MTPEEQPTTRASSVKKEENPAALTRLAGSKLDPTVSTTSRKAARPTRDSKGARDLSVVSETFSFPVNGMIFVLPVSEIFPLPGRLFFSFPVNGYDLSIASETFVFSVNGMVVPVSVNEIFPLPEIFFFHFQ